MHYRCFHRITGPLVNEVARIGGGAKLLIAALSVLALSACAAAVRKTFRCPEQGGTAWTRVVSDHFVLLTDQDRQVAEATSSELEMMLWALSDHAFRSPNRPKMTVEVVAFKDGDEYETVASGAAGVFIPGGLRDFERRPLALVKGDLRQSRATFQHELTHFLVHYYLPHAPMWLNEGLAQFYETLTLEDGEIKIGLPLTAMNTWTPDDYDPDSLMSPLMSIEQAPSVAALLALDPLEFHGHTDVEPDNGRVIQTLQREVVNYVCAWNLVHLFLTDEKYRRAFGSYLVGLSGGEEHDFAWERTLGSLDREKLEADYQAHLRASRFNIFRAKYSLQRLPPTRVEALSHSEVHLLWARLRPWNDRTAREAAQQELRHVAEREPDNMELGLLKAWSALAEHQPGEAERAIAAISPEHRNDARVLNATGWVKLAPLIKRKSTKYSDYALALHGTVTKLAPIARSAAELDLLARYHAGRGNLDEGIAYEKRAVQADPNCIPCFSAAAQMMNDKGLVREALQVATTALGLLPKGERSDILLEQVATFRRGLAAPPKPPAPAASTSASPPLASAPQRTKPPRTAAPAGSARSR